MDKEQAISLIKQKIGEIDTNINKFTIGGDSHIYLEEWQEGTLDILREIFVQKPEKWQEFKNNFWSGQSYVVLGEEDYEDTQYKIQSVKKLKLQLERFIQHIKDFGLNSNTFALKEKPITQNIEPYTNHFHIQQTQEVHISIIVKNIFEGLDDSEKEALKKILQQYDKDRNKNNLIQSLQSVGKGVVENILANIITNPELIGQIINTLS